MLLHPTLDELSRLRAKDPDVSFLPVSLDLPADVLTPVNAFLRLRAAGARKMFLLESADGGENVGRYSFLGLDPFASLKAQDGQLTFQNFQTGDREAGEASFAAIGRYLSRYRSPRVPGLPPLAGGVLGYFAYDCVRFLEDIPKPSGTPYSAHDLHFMFFRTILCFDRLRHRLQIVQLIQADQPLESTYEEARQRLATLRAHLANPAPQEELFDLSLAELKAVEPVAASSSLGESVFSEHVQTIKKHIRAGDIFQCVLSDRFQFPVATDSFLIYRVLRMINPSPYLYYLQFDEETLLGSSPEMLVRVEGRQLETSPIAGTRPRGSDEDEDLKREKDLLASVKEKAEHLMLVDLGRNDVGRVSRPGTVRVKTFMAVERYSHVMHLVSRVTGELKPKLSPWDALGSCFPAGTLSGAPKIRAMEIISRLEGSPRGPYGGAVICQDFSGGLNTCITIRSLYIRDGVGYAQAGAGIVADSRPQSEYQEVLNKARAIRTAVAAAARVEAGR